MPRMKGLLDVVGSILYTVLYSTIVVGRVLWWQHSNARASRKGERVQPSVKQGPPTTVRSLKRHSHYVIVRNSHIIL